MRIKQICMVALLSLGIAPWTKAQTFDKLWKQVEQAEQKSLPKTVIQLTGDIYRKAQVEKDSPQMLKAYTWRMKYRDMLTPDSFYVSLEGLQQWEKTTDKPMDRAVLNSLIAGIYADYAMNNRWAISQRPDIVDETPPADMREWSGNMFVQRVVRHTAEALKDKKILLDTSSRTYIPFVELGDDSKYYHHDMFHLLGSRGIDALRSMSRADQDSVVKTGIANIYQEMLDTYKNADMKDGYILTMLNYLDWRRESDRSFAPYRAPRGLIGLTQDPYLAGLDKLIAEFKSNDICAEVYLAKARFAMEQGQQTSALQICDEAVKLYPGYKRINALKNLKLEILNPYLNINADPTAYPGDSVKLVVTHKNLDGFKVRIYKMKKLVSEQHFSLLRTENYQQQDTTFFLKAPEEGKYVMQVIPDVKTKDNVEKELSVTHFKVLTLRLPGQQYAAVVLDNRTGQPIEGAVVAFYSGDKKKLAEFTTNADGKAVFPYDEKYRYLAATKGSDAAMPLQNFYGRSFGIFSEEKPMSRVQLLTDRTLYRPGQTVFVKGIAYEQRQDTADVIANRNYVLKMTDANWQEVGQKELRTNAFGSFTTEFTLPAACMNGSFTLSTENGSVTIRVEDYKRPTFDITFDELKGSYGLGDKVEVKGVVKTFSGVALQDLPMTYTVSRELSYGWRWPVMMENASAILVSDTVQLNVDGQFSIPVKLEGDKSIDKEMGLQYYTFRVNATVTDLAGETQTSTFVLNVGNRSMVLGVELTGPICKDDSIKATFTATNLGGQPVAVEGGYKLYPVQNGAKSEDVVKGTPAYTGTFTSNKETLLNGWATLPSGEYLLVLSAKDDQGREVTFRETIVLFSVKDTRPPVNTSIWYYAQNTSFDAAHPAVFYYGTSKKDVYVMMNLFSGDKMLESKALHLSDSIVRFEYPYKESYGNGLSIAFCFVKEGSVNQQTVEMKKRLSDKTLVLKWDVFRDKLRPGQAEEWKLTIKTPLGTPAVAEMLATMYDASLDKIWKQKQALSVFYNLSVPTVRWESGYWGMNSYNYWFPFKSLKVEPMVYDRFADPAVGEELIGSTGRKKFKEAGGISIRGASTRMNASAKDEAYQRVEPESEKVFAASFTREEAGETLPEATEALRTNFAETAFFYPQLRTNEQGEIAFSFTMPQSLTRWSFRGYAHTKGMLTGMLDANAVTGKEFMLTPNLPRFVRVGDDTSVAASIANLTGKNIAGTVSFVLFDPMTEKVISTQKQKFTVEAGRTIGVNFMFTVTDKYDVLGCRMIADGGTFSDGEQHLLPVLSNKANLVESVPMPIRGNETRTFSLDSLFNRHSKSATDRRLTIEFTGNPSWYAVQALPSLSMPENNNAISWATAYYANTLASYIMNSQPRIKAMFDSWKLQGGTKETFLSNLQKNQEVKNILLSESPWVMEAKTEEEQKGRIATLFDLNNILNNNITALTRLQELQQPDGSWPWYKGMNGSRYITNYVVELNARLSQLTGKPLEGNALTMQRNAFNFLNKEALEEYKSIRKAEKNGGKATGLSGAALQYLYLIAISGEKVPADTQVAYNYFLSKVGETLTTRSMAYKALAAIVLAKSGRKKEAQEFITSLKEYLTKTDEQGMFFAFNESPYSWGGLQIPAHVDVMEAFDLVSDNSVIVEEMKLWLLKQKQTQAWDSPVTTADAVYALLLRGTNLLDNQGDVRIVIANEVLETLAPAKATVPGLGYIKKTFTEKKVVDARQVTVEKRDAGIAWGAVYAQYQEDINKVKQQGGELNVDKKLYVERLVNNVRQLQPVTADTKLAIGDKVVSRLTIRLDRPMDFIQLKDQRGACFEPIGSLSGYRWNNGFGYYVDIKDASTNFFFDGLGKGVFVLEYSYRVSRAGTYETGLATIQSAYAPEYVSHSTSMKVTVK